MNKLKIIPPNLFLDKEQYIFYDFGNGLELTNSETVDTVENCVDKTDEFKIGLKKINCFLSLFRFLSSLW